VDTVQTDNNGEYEYNPGAPGTFIVRPVSDRLQSPDPLERRATSGGLEANFTLRGVPAKLTFANQPAGTFILVTPGPYAGAGSHSPPAVRQTDTNVPLTFSTIVNADGSASVSVPAGTYYVTCWRPVVSGPRVTYMKSASLVLNTALTPLEVRQTICPR